MLSLGRLQPFYEPSDYVHLSAQKYTYSNNAGLLLCNDRERNSGRIKSRNGVINDLMKIIALHVQNSYLRRAIRNRRLQIVWQYSENSSVYFPHPSHVLLLAYHFVSHYFKHFNLFLADRKWRVLFERWTKVSMKRWSIRIRISACSCYIQ